MLYKPYSSDYKYQIYIIKLRRNVNHQYEIFGVRSVYEICLWDINHIYWIILCDIDDFMIYCLYGLFCCAFVNTTDGRTIRILFYAWIYHYLTFIQEISIVITSSYQVIEVSPFTTALIEHIYAQYQRSNARFYDDRVSVAVSSGTLIFGVI